MKRNWRRYEILLPLRYNDKRPVPRELVEQTVKELRDRFAAVSYEGQIIHGRWSSGGRAFRDDSVRVYVDAKESVATRQFFARFKLRVEKRFKQSEIWLTSHPINVL